MKTYPRIVKTCKYCGFPVEKYTCTNLECFAGLLDGNEIILTTMLLTEDDDPPPLNIKDIKENNND